MAENAAQEPGESEQMTSLALPANPSSILKSAKQDQQLFLND